jgi:hypothetical protein
MKQEDDRRTPPFARLRQAAASPARTAPRRATWKLAAAAALLLAVGGAALVAQHLRAPLAPGPSPSIASRLPDAPGQTETGAFTWESPTAFLLEPPVRPESGGGAA